MMRNYQNVLEPVYIGFGRASELGKVENLLVGTVGYISPELLDEKVIESKRMAQNFEDCKGNYWDVGK